MSTTVEGLQLSFTKLSFWGHSANDIFWFILPVLLPAMITDYGLSYAGAGGVLTLYLSVVALFSIVAGRLSDSFHPTRLIGLGFLLASLGFVLAAASSRILVLMGTLAFAAVGVSVFHPAIYGMADRHIQRERGRFFGRFESYGSGAMVTVLLVSGLVFPQLGWRALLAAAAIPGVAAGYLFLRQTNSLTVGTSEADDSPIDPGAPVDGLSRWHFTLFLMSNLLRFISVMGVMSFLPTFLEAHATFRLVSGELITGSYFLGGLIGARITGALADKMNPLRLFPLLLGLIPAMVLVFPGIRSLPLLLAALFVFGAASIGCVPLQNVLMRKFRSGIQAGHAFGILLGAMTLAQAFSPALFGATADSVGLIAATRLFALPAVLAMVLLVRFGVTIRAAAKAAT